MGELGLFNSDLVTPTYFLIVLGGGGNFAGSNLCLTVPRIIITVLVAAATVDDYTQQGCAIKRIESALDSFLLTETFADHHEMGSMSISAAKRAAGRM